MFGQNPKRATLFNDGTSLEIKSIFKTLQGEGPFVGMPAIFIRLGGCNLACNFCDTDFENFSMYDINDIIKEVLKLATNVNLIVITGGEPLRQNIELLCSQLIKLNFIIQVETNGTIYRPLADEVHIVCSPKVGNKGYFRLRDDLLSRINAIKFLIAKNLPHYSNVPELGQNKYNIPIFVQPMDQNDQYLNKENERLAVDLALQHGYRLSLQIHKILNIE